MKYKLKSTTVDTIVATNGHVLSYVVVDDEGLYEMVKAAAKPAPEIVSYVDATEIEVLRVRARLHNSNQENKYRPIEVHSFCCENQHQVIKIEELIADLPKLERPNRAFFDLGYLSHLTSLLKATSGRGRYSSRIQLSFPKENGSMLIQAYESDSLEVVEQKTYLMPLSAAGK